MIYDVTRKPTGESCFTCFPYLDEYNSSLDTLTWY